MTPGMTLKFKRSTVGGPMTINDATVTGGETLIIRHPDGRPVVAGDLETGVTYEVENGVLRRVG